MKTIALVLGQDVSAFARVNIEVPLGASKEDIIAAAKKQYKGGEDVFTVDWGFTNNYRILSIEDETGFIAQGIPV